MISTLVQNAYRRGRREGAAFVVLCQASTAMEAGHKEQARQLVKAASDYSSPEHVKEQIFDGTEFSNLKTLLTDGEHHS